MNDIVRCTTCVKRNKDCEHPEHAKKHPEEGCREWSNGEVFIIDEKDIIRVEDYEEC